MHLLLLIACTSAGEPHESATDTSADTGTADSGESDSADTDTGTPAGLDEADLEAFRTRVGRDLNGAMATGASVAFWKNGAIVYAEGFGSADPEAEVPVTADTLFQVGSDTKKITAIAVLQQVEAGALSLDETIASALPDVEIARSPEWNEVATLHDVLSHQSGLIDYVPWEDAPGDEVLAEHTTGEFSDRGWANNPAGVFWNYSNPGYAMAGLLAERAAGVPYADLVVERVFTPLGMNHTYAREADIPADSPTAVGNGFVVTEEGQDWFDPWRDPVEYEYGPADLETTIDNGFARPAGMVWSTATDMCTLAGFLATGDPAVLSEESLALLTTSHVRLIPSDPTQGYGYGLFVITYYPDSDGGYHDIPFWLHGGNTHAYTSLFYVVPEQQFAVCILSNGYADDFSASAYRAIDLFADVPEAITAPDPPAYDVDPATHAGHFEDPDLGPFDITFDGEDLSVEFPIMETLGYPVQPRLTPIWNEIYAMNIGGGDFYIYFIDGEDGTPSKYVRNRMFVGTRTE